MGRRLVLSALLVLCALAVLPSVYASDEDEDLPMVLQDLNAHEKEKEAVNAKDKPVEKTGVANTGSRDDLGGTAQQRFHLTTNAAIIEQREALQSSELYERLQSLPTTKMESNMIEVFRKLSSVVKVTPAELYSAMMSVMSRLVSKVKGVGASTVPFHNPSFFGGFKKGFTWDVPSDYFMNFGMYLTDGDISLMKPKSSIETTELRNLEIYQYLLAMVNNHIADVDADELVISFLRDPTMKNVKGQKSLYKHKEAMLRYRAGFWQRYGIDDVPSSREVAERSMNIFTRFAAMCDSTVMYSQDRVNLLKENFEVLLSTFTFAPRQEICTFAWSLVDYGVSATCLQRRLKMPCFALPREKASQAEDADSYVQFAPFCPAHVIASDMAGTREFANVAYPPVQECEGQNSNILFDIYRIFKNTEKDKNTSYNVYCDRFQQLSSATCHPSMMSQASKCYNTMSILVSSKHLVPGPRCPTLKETETCISHSCCTIGPCTAAVLGKLEKMYADEESKWEGIAQPYDAHWQLALNVAYNKLDMTSTSASSLRNLHLLEATKTGTLAFKDPKKKGSFINMPQCNLEVNDITGAVATRFLRPAFSAVEVYFEYAKLMAKGKPLHENTPPEHGEYSGANTFAIITAKELVAAKPVDSNAVIVDTSAFSSSFHPTSQASSRFSSRGSSTHGGVDQGVAGVMDDGLPDMEEVSAPYQASIRESHEDAYARKEMGSLAVTPLD